MVAVLQSLQVPRNFRVPVSFFSNYDAAFAWIVRTDKETIGDPNMILDKLMDDDETRVKVKFIRALIEHPRTDAVHGFKAACMWDQWYLAKRFFDQVDKDVKEEGFFGAIQAKSTYAVEELAPLIDVNVRTEALNRTATFAYDSKKYVNVFAVLLDHCHDVDLREVSSTTPAIRELLEKAKAKRAKNERL